MNEIEEYNGFQIHDSRGKDIEAFVSELPRFSPSVVLSDNDVTLRGYFNNIYILDYSIQNEADAKKFIDILLSVKDMSVGDVIKEYRNSDKIGNKKFTLFNKYLHLEDLEEQSLIAIKQIVDKYLPQIDKDINIEY